MNVKISKFLFDINTKTCNKIFSALEINKNYETAEKKIISVKRILRASGAKTFLA